MKKQFSAEAVAAGHPDKIADQIADSIVDACLEKDPLSRVAVDALVTKNKIILAGEISSQASINYEKIARQAIKNLGYVNPDWQFSDKSPLECCIHQQSPEIALGVNDDGAGDQGVMYGFACGETAQLMPLPIMLAQELVKRMDEIREEKVLDYLRPDGKSQVVVDYENNRPIQVSTVILAVPHEPAIKRSQLEADLWELVVLPAIKKYLPKQIVKKEEIKFIVNGTGVWHLGGPASDTGLTGRKIMVDTYGGLAHHGGGCFSGKDATKVDRSGAYGARFLAKNIVAHNLAEHCEIKVGYAIGCKRPVIFDIETFGTNNISVEKIKKYGLNLLDMSFKNIIERLDLRRPIFAKTASYGHFGRAEFTWEKVVK
jgi:S-adenosylmethionine synthetase